MNKRQKFVMLRLILLLTFDRGQRGPERGAPKRRGKRATMPQDASQRAGRFGPRALIKRALNQNRSWGMVGETDTANPQFSGEHSSCLMFSDAIGLMLLTHDHYRQFTQRPIGDARCESQALLALSVDDREAVVGLGF